LLPDTTKTNNDPVTVSSVGWRIQGVLLDAGARRPYEVEVGFGRSELKFGTYYLNIKAIRVMLGSAQRSGLGRPPRSAWGRQQRRGHAVHGVGTTNLSVVRRDPPSSSGEV
jgi:hypothetical protein